MFDTHSSISFFKLLADVVNSEHWGIANRGPDLLRLNFPDLPWDQKTAEAVCSEVFSVTFYNSIAVVTKADPTTNRAAGMGSRLVLGSEPGVIDSPLSGSKIALDESGNPLSDFPLTSKPV